MNLSLLDIVANTDDGNFYFSNKAESFIYAGIGIVVVFLGILILIGLLMLVGFIFKKCDEKGLLTKKKKIKPKSEEKVTEPVTVTADDADIPDKVKAAIVAAIMAYYQTEQPQCEFTVKRIKRI